MNESQLVVRPDARVVDHHVGTVAQFAWPESERRSASRPEAARAESAKPVHAMYGRRKSDRLQLPTIGRAKRVSRRAIDLAVAIPALILLTPLFVLVAIAVKATSRGPVFFRQTRVGREHSHFRIVKFRTMRDGTYHEVRNDPDLWQQYVQNGFKLPTSHPTITRVGMVLRKTSLDELPQLINVIRGQMSIVGVRPLVPLELGERNRRSQGLYGLLQPGMTGLWQVCGRSLVKADDRVALDDEYVVTWSPRRDLAILLRTPLAVLRPSHCA